MTQALQATVILAVGLSLVACLVAVLIAARRRRLRSLGRPVSGAWRWRFFFTALAVHLVLHGAFWAWFVLTGRGLAGHTPLAWAGIAGCALLGGMAPTVIHQRLELAESSIVLAVLGVLAWSLIYPIYSEQGVAAIEVRTLVVGPFAAMLLAAVGGGLSYLVIGGGRADPRWGVEALIGWRFL